jgi:hypothetical protein
MFATVTAASSGPTRRHRTAKLAKIARMKIAE